jgi:hypothetical protein
MTTIELQMLDENERPYDKRQLREFEENFEVTITEVAQDAGPAAPTFRIVGERDNVEAALRYQFPDAEIEEYEVTQ